MNFSTIFSAYRIAPLHPFRLSRLSRASSFFAQARKISTLKPLTVCFCRCLFDAENGEQDLPILPRFRLHHFNGKTVCTPAAVIVSICGAARPAPSTSNKEQNGDYCVTERHGHLEFFYSSEKRLNTSFLSLLQHHIRGRQGM